MKSEAGIATLLIKVCSGAGKIAISAALPGDVEPIALYVEATINTSGKHK